MKLASAAALFGMVVALVGCSQESTPGGPGASSATKMNTSTTTAPTSSTSVTTTANKPVTITDKNKTFTLKVPEMTTTVRPGKKEELTISISRGSAFKESVKIQFRAPKGVTMTPAEPVIPAGQDKVSVTVQSTKDAPVGKTNIEVMAIPESGRSVSLELPIEVKPN